MKIGFNVGMGTNYAFSSLKGQTFVVVIFLIEKTDALKYISIYVELLTSIIIMPACLYVAVRGP